MEDTTVGELPVDGPEPDGMALPGSEDFDDLADHRMPRVSNDDADRSPEAVPAPLRLPDGWAVHVEEVRRQRNLLHGTVAVNHGGEALHTDRIALADAKARRGIVQGVVKAAQARGINCPEAALSAELVKRHLEAETQAHAPVAVPATAGPEYEERNGCTYWLRRDRDGLTPVLLAQWTARIAADVAHDDGAEVRRIWHITAEVGGRTRTVQVPAREYPAMSWTAMLGASAIVAPGLAVRDGLRHSIQVLSGEVPERTIYGHLGWRDLPGVGWTYLHAGGAVGAAGLVADVEVDPPDSLRRVVLPDPPDRDALAAAVQSSLRVLDVAPLHITAPVYAAMTRAVLAPADYSLHLAGHTGAGKTALAALAQAHWGADLWDGRRPLASWIGTANSLEGLAHAAADALLLVDDYAPGGTATDIARLHREADRLLRAAGNRSGRSRMRPDGSLRPDRPPRGTILSTGEDIPPGQSLRARTFVVEVSGTLGAPGADVNKTTLTACQAAAAGGLYAQAMAGYVRWLAPRIAEVRAGLGAAARTLRSELLAEGLHPRTPDIIAHLLVGLRHWITYANEVGAVTEREATDLLLRCREALRQAAADQARHDADADPVRLLARLLGAALTNGHAHMAAGDGREPENAEAWGWRRTDGELARRPMGERIGWLDGDALYLHPTAAVAAAQAIGARTGETLALSPTTLGRRLREAGWFVATDGARGTLTVRRTLEGRRRDVWAMRDGYLSLPEPDHDPRGPDGSGRSGWSGASAEPDQDPTTPDHNPTTNHEAWSGSAAPWSGDGRVFEADPTTQDGVVACSVPPVVGLVGSQDATDTHAAAILTPSADAPPTCPVGHAEPSRFWRTRNGPWVCETCYRPARPDLAQWWDEAEARRV